jgi:glycerophosphoryl diester phosphodiesterase
VYTFNIEKVIAMMIEKGVDAIIADYPEIAISEIEKSDSTQLER